MVQSVFRDINNFFFFIFEVSLGMVRKVCLGMVTKVCLGMSIDLRIISRCV